MTYAVARTQDNQYSESEPSGSIDGMPTEIVAVSMLLAADSPRLSGEETAHVKMLAQTESALPPILVHRVSMRVVDGMHRLMAAKLRGETEIAVRFVDGTDDEVFLLAVRENIRHGLPLSLADREAAAERVVTKYPAWSDRAVGAATGIAAKTVRAIRHRSSEHLPQSSARIGRDGRIRPLNGAEGRRRAVEVIARRPNASLREIAREAHISLGTAHSVRTRLAANEDPLQPTSRPRVDTERADGPRVTAAPARLRAVADRYEPTDWSEVRPLLQRDPALRYSQSGRALLHWLNAHSIDTTDWRQLVDAVPSHWANVIASVALHRAEEWRRFAEHASGRKA